MQINIGIAFDVRGPGDVFAVRRKVAAVDLPFIFGEPGNLLAGNIEQPDIVVAIRGIRSDQQLLAVGRKSSAW